MDDLSRRVAEHPGWYHTIDLAPGVTTPGFCDLRPFAPQALPDSLSDRRCLDVGTFDGFWAFQMEQRGATVYALDLPDGTEADWPPNTREANLAESRATGLEWGSGFKLAHAALGSSVRRVEGNVYDLDVAWLDGEPVDAVLCGTILQHLRDPVRALENMREVLRPGGELMMIEAYSVPLTRRHPKRPVAEFRPAVPGSKFTWWLPNVAALRGMAETAGFRPVEGSPVARHRPLRGAGKGDHVISMRYTR
jgi:tRNA (mo5U34)-methyltransferase